MDIKITVCKKCWKNRTEDEYNCTCKEPEQVEIEKADENGQG